MEDTSFFGGSNPNKGAVRARDLYKEGVQVDQYGNELEGIGSVNNSTDKNSASDIENTDLFNQLFGDAANALKNTNSTKHDFVKITSVKQPPVVKGGNNESDNSDSHTSKK